MKPGPGGESPRMKRFLLLASVAALCAVVPGLATAQMSSMGPAHLTIPLYSQNDSQETGTATLVQSGPDVLVSVRVQNPVADNQPAHIHMGTCANLNPRPQYPFPNITNRRTQARIKNVTLASLLETPHAINIHRSTTQASIYVACGDIKRPA
jgi:hypothetical protein